jgi:hypothetical protein
LTGSLFLSQGIWAMKKIWDSSNFQNRYIFGNVEIYWKGVWSSLLHSYWVWQLWLDGELIFVTRNLINEKNLRFEQLSKSLYFWECQKILKRSLIIPAPQLLGLIAKTWRKAYFSHKESEQWKKFEIRATFKIAIFLGMVKNIEKEFDHPCSTIIGFNS